MAWTAFPTLTDGQVLTGARMQAIKGNFDECPAAKATAAGRIFASTGANALAERQVSSAAIATSQTTTSATFTDLATVGPQVTVSTSTHAIAFVQTNLSNSIASTITAAGVAVSSATTIAASDDEAIIFQPAAAAGGGRHSVVVHYNGTLTPGSNIFTMKYRCSANTATFLNRKLTVMAL